jgi:hypothetical protein
MRKIRLCRSVSFREKNGVYVFYVDFNFIFFRGVASSLIEPLSETIDSLGGVSVKGIPDDFVDYLLSKKIAEEVNDD